MADKSYTERLQAVNKRMNTRNIKGKDYAEVNQRVLAFWELFPDGAITSEMLSDDGERCEFVARVYRDGLEQVADTPAATGHAFEVRADRHSMVNQTSYVENCETSAIGRALGMLGIGATVAIASAEEVENAIAQQAAPRAAQRPRKAQAAPKDADAGKTSQTAPQGATDGKRQPGKWDGVRYWLESARACGLTDADVAAWCEKNFPGVDKKEYGGSHIAALETWLREYVSGGNQGKKESIEA